MKKKDQSKTTRRPLPRSILGTLREPLFDPKDGHGARSARDVTILQNWGLAKQGDDDALLRLMRIIVRENLAALKEARNTTRIVSKGGGRMEIHTLIPVMSLLKMITVETAQVPPERDGLARVTTRKKICLEEWFEDYGFGREGVDPNAVTKVKDWIDRGALQRPFRGEPCD